MGADGADGAGLPRFVPAAALRAALPVPGAVDALEVALRSGLDPDATPPRTSLEVPAGQLLLMPAWDERWVGTKVVGVAPANPARGLPRITAVYLLLDGPTLAPVAVIDGAALTLLRTPAVAALAARHLAQPGAERLVVFGAGPQAEAHVYALRTVRPLSDVRVVGRSAERAEALASRLRGNGVEASVAGPDAVRQADVVACCTSSRRPLFDGSALPDSALVVAIGAHEPDAREVDDAAVARSTVVVESRTAARREAGALLLAEAAGAIGPDHVAGDLADLVTGRLTSAPARPRLFLGVGTAWEDLVVAAAAVRRLDPAA